MRTPWLLLLLGASGCAQLLGLSEPSEGNGPDSSKDGGTTPPGDGGGPFMDGGNGPPGSCAPAPSFAAPSNYIISGDPRMLAVGDLDNDGFKDVILANGNPGGDASKSLTIYHGLGGGTLGRAQDVSLSFVSPCMPGSQVVAVGDFDGNGFQDIIASAGSFCGQSKVVVRRQDPANIGKFLAEQQVTTADMNVMRLTVGNLNGDNRDDLVVSGMNGIQVLLARTDLAGAFTGGFAETGFANPKAGAQIADLNGDGRNDFGWLGSSTMRYTLQTPTPGQFGTAQNLGGSSPIGMALGQLDGDALDDAYVMPMTGNGQVFVQNPSSHMLIAASQVQMAGGGQDTQIADVNHDGRNDIVMGGNAVLQCAPPAMPGTFPMPGSPGPPAQILNAQTVVFADLSGDGRVDAIGIDPGNSLLVVVVQH